MKISDVLIILATILGPILAVQAQKYLEKWRESKDRKVSIFKTLMATRATRLSAEHVQSLNLIDVEFYHGRNKYKNVIESWKAYHDHLSQKTADDTISEVWGERCEDLFVNLLYQMGHSLGYEFDKTHIRRAHYSPQLHNEIEEDQHALRKALLAVFSGKKPIAMNITDFPEMQDTESQKLTNQAIIQLLRSQGALTNSQAILDPSSNGVIIEEK